MLAVVQAGCPAVPVGALALAQRDGDHLHIGIGCQDLVAEGLVLGTVQLTGFHDHVGGDFQGLLHIFLVGDGHIHVIGQFSHDLGCTHAVLPEILAEVQVAGDRDAALLGFLHGLEAEILRALGDGRGDAGDVEPLDAFKSLVPVNVAGAGNSDGGAGTVVDNLARAGIGAGLEIVDAETALVGTDNAAGIHAKLAKLFHALVRDDVFRQNGQEGHILVIVGQGDRHIGLAAAEGGLEHRTLEESLQTGRFKTKHDFAEGHEFHNSFLHFHFECPPLPPSAGAGCRSVSYFCKR